MTKRTTYSASFKKRVVVAALKENKTVTELAQDYKISPSQIVKWKSQVLDGIEDLFESNRKKKKESDVDIEEVYAQLGKTQAQLEFLKKKTGIDS